MQAAPRQTEQETPARDAEIGSLVESFPKLWHRYFAETESRSDATLTDSGVEFRVQDLPAWHASFENFLIGYMKEMLEIYCANPVRAQRLTSGSSTSYAYLLATDPVPSAGPNSERVVTERRLLRPARMLTERELEVLQLVLDGGLQGPCLGREADSGEAAAVRPYLSVIRDAVHRDQGGRVGVKVRLGPDWNGGRRILPIRLVKR